jgi:Tol biopolymer transport system component
VERSGEVVTRDELVAILWPTETEVDVEHGLNSAVRRLRDALGDSAERPVFVETVPRIGYRFVGTVHTPSPTLPDGPHAAEIATAGLPPVPRPEPSPVSVAASAVRRWRLLAATILLIAAAASVVAWRERQTKGNPNALHPEPVRLTFEDGLQTDPSISRDGEWIAYTSDKSGNFDVWVRRISGGDPVQVTHDKAADYQPDWSPDGSRLVFRSERAGGGLFVTPVTGGNAQRISNSGFRPRWSPDGRQILFAERVVTGLNLDLRVIDLDRPVTHSWPGTATGAYGWQPDVSSSTVLELASLFGPFEPSLVSWTAGAPSLNPWTFADPVRREFRAQQLVVVSGQQVLLPPRMSALYFVGSSRGKRALWQLEIDSAARRVTAGPHRITTLPDANNASLSPDGRRVVFDGSAQNARIVTYPLDDDGHPAAEPMAITSEATDATSPAVSRDGRAFAFVLTLPGSPERSELTARLRDQPRDQTIRVIDHPREVVTMPRWNDTGTKLAYSVVVRANDASAQQQLRIFDAATGDDVPLTSAHSPAELMEFPTGWSPDGRHVIVTSWNYVSGDKTIARVSIDSAPSAERSRQIITTSSGVGISQGTMSPDHRWVAFRVGELEGLAPRIAIVPATGGGSATWTFITSGVEPADKPGWSDDGTTLYYTSGNDTLNVLGIRFDTDHGRPSGEPFSVTQFSGPGGHVHSDLRTLELGVGGRRLVVPIVRPKGGLWTMELRGR